MVFLSRVASVLFVVGCAAETTGSSSVSGGSGSDQASDSGSGSGSGSSTSSGGFRQVNLVSDETGVAANLDVDLVNPWGVALDDSMRAFWIADNDSGKVSIVDDTGAALATKSGAKIDLGKGITGAAKNPSTTAFLIQAQTHCAAAHMLFSTEGGQIIAFHEDIDAARGVIVADRAAQGASYKGLAIVAVTPTTFRILAPDFHNARIDVFDENFQLVTADNPIFVDTQLPAGYAPFNVVQLGDKVYVTYALQDADKADAVTASGLGMVDEFALDGTFVRTIAPSQQLLNAPWGVALAPANFCKSTANALLVGNFGDGHIIAIDATTGRLLGELANDQGQILAIDGLWSLTFGDDTTGQGNRLFFTAGPADEAHGLFGYLQANE